MILILDDGDCNIMKAYKVFTHMRDLSYFKYHHCEFTSSQFFKNEMSHIDFMASTFDECAFSSTSLRNANLSHVKFKRTNFYRVDFTNANIEGTVFDHCTFYECQLPIDFYNRAEFHDWNIFSKNNLIAEAESQSQEDFNLSALCL